MFFHLFQKGTLYSTAKSFSNHQCTHRFITYYKKQRELQSDEAYLEKLSNWGRGWYTRLSVGNSQPEYGGVSTNGSLSREFKLGR